jgi:hypothetical protein
VIWWLAVMLYGLPIPFSCREAVSHETSPVARPRHREAADMAKITYGESQLRDGDLVVRTGNDFISLTLRQFSRQGRTYSHCGLVRIEQGRVFVYHAIGGEDNPNARLRRDTFAEFCSPSHNLGFGIFRYRFSEAQVVRLDSIIEKFYRQKPRFDLKFDLKTDTSLYCAEFIYKAVNRAMRRADFIPTSHIGDFQYVAIDNLYLNPHCRPVYQARFE